MCLPSTFAWTSADLVPRAWTNLASQTFPTQAYCNPSKKERRKVWALSLGSHKCSRLAFIRCDIIRSCSQEQQCPEADAGRGQDVPKFTMEPILSRLLLLHTSAKVKMLGKETQRPVVKQLTVAKRPMHQFLIRDQPLAELCALEFNPRS